MDQDMLDRINGIDWASLGYADMPQLLAGLTSPEFPSRSIEQIEAYVTRTEVFDGTRSPVETLATDLPVAVLPFLIELLEKNLAVVKFAIIDQIDTLLLYHENRQRFVQIYNLNEVHLARASRMHQIIRQHVALFELLAEDRDHLTASYAKTLLDNLRKIDEES